jgi:hypothetical protein
MPQIPEKLLEEVQDAVLSNVMPFKHVTFMSDDGKIFNSFSLDEGWEHGFLEIRFSPQGYVTASLTWTMSSTSDD